MGTWEPYVPLESLQGCNALNASALSVIGSFVSQRLIFCRLLLARNSIRLQHLYKVVNVSISLARLLSSRS